VTHTQQGIKKALLVRSFCNILSSRVIFDSKKKSQKWGKSRYKCLGASSSLPADIYIFSVKLLKCKGRASIVWVQYGARDKELYPWWNPIYLKKEEPTEERELALSALKDPTSNQSTFLPQTDLHIWLRDTSIFPGDSVPFTFPELPPSVENRVTEISL
jgi:hypothetical protein